MRHTRRNVPFIALCALLAFAGSPGRAADSLTVFDWSGYEADSLHPAYAAQHGGAPNFSYFADEEEGLQKLKAGFKADVAHPCSQSIPKWQAAGVLDPIDTSRVKEWNNIIPELAHLKGFTDTGDGKTWVMPYDWGQTMLVYNSTAVKPEELASIRNLTDPKFAGAISIGDNVSDAYALASLAIGMKDWNSMSDEQFKQASEWLRALHKNVKFYWSDPTQVAQSLASGEVKIAWAWNETLSTLQNDGQPAARAATQEGDTSWVCGYVLLKGGDGSRDLAYDFLNAALDPAVSPTLMNDWGYGHGNGAGMAAIPADTLKAKGFTGLEGLKGSLMQSPLPLELSERMSAEFERIKAGY